MPSVGPLHDLHAAAAAVFVERRGFEVVASYGDPAAEYDAALDGPALVDLTERGVLEASGPKRLSFLQGMLSNDVEGRPPGQGCRAAMMTVKGHVVALVRALVDTDTVRLETETERLAPLQRTLEHHRVGAPVRFRPLSVSVVAVLGMRAGDVLKAAGVDPPLDPESHRRVSLGGHDVVLARAGDLPGGGFVLHVAPEGVAESWGALRAAGARPVGRGALDARRVEDLRPWYGVDITEDNLLHETGLVGECHSPTKGCYLGQETVARLEARGGHVNKALRRLRLSAPATPEEPVTHEGREVGKVTTTAHSRRFGPIALAYVHRSCFAGGTSLEVAGAPATVVDGFHEE